MLLNEEKTAMSREKIGVIIINVFSWGIIIIGGGYLIAKYTLPLMGMTLVD